MRRRQFLGQALIGSALAPRPGGWGRCPCASSSPETGVSPEDPLTAVASGLHITNLKVFGVSLNRESDRPYVFVKLETNQGVIGWGEATLEGKAGAVLACV